MKYLRCIDPTKSLIKGEAYLCRMVHVKENLTKIIEYDTEQLYDAHYVYVQTVYGSHGGNLRVRADRFEEITPQPSMNYMQKQIEPVYNLSYQNGEDDNYKTNVSKDVIKENIESLVKYYRDDYLLSGDWDDFTKIEKISVKDGRIVTEDITNEIKINISVIIP